MQVWVLGVVIRIASITLPRHVWERRYRAFLLGFGFKFCGRLWGTNLYPLMRG